MQNNIIEDENFYKNICKKYINTMNIDRLLEGERIIHFYVSGDYFSVKIDSDVTFDEIKHIRNKNYGIYDYSSYKDFFNAVIKKEIYVEIQNLGLFDLDGSWNFYLTFEELKKIEYGYMVKEHYPLIEKYGVSDENLKDFFNHFSLEQLDDFEESLRFYFIEKSIVYDGLELTYSSNSHFESKENYSFNSDILRLACGLISYEDFIKDYVITEPSKESLIEQDVIKYFYENKIENLKEYGCDEDEGLYKLSSLYSELMDKLNIKYSNIFTEDGISGGKYITTIYFDNETKVIIDTKSRDSIEYVRDNLISISEEYKKWLQKEQAKENKNEIDINY